MTRKTLLLGSAALMSLATPGASWAQAGPQDSSAEDSLDQGEIIVTARRRDERLQDVPAAISVIDAQALFDRGGARDARELLADQPSVRFNNLNSNITSEISIRASSTARATNGDPSVGLYRNGAYIAGGAIGGRNFTRLDFLDIARVEVLRGTQGALYGRNAVGGAVNIVSAQPEFANSGFVTTRYDFETQGIQAQGAINLKLGDDLAIRVSGDGIHQDGGFFYNPVHDVYFDQQKGYGARGQLRWRSGPIDIVLLAEHQDMTVPTIHYQLAIARGTPGFPGGVLQPRFSYDWSTRPNAQQDVTTFQAFAKIDLGGGTTLTSTSHYRERRSGYDLDTDGSNAAALAALRASGAVTAVTDPNGESFTRDFTRSFHQDLHLAGSAAGGRLDWLIGADAVILKDDYSVTVGRTPTVPNPSTGSFAPATLEQKSYGVYGSLGYDLTDALNVTGELRYTKDDRSLSARLFDRGTGAPLGGAARVIDARIEPDNVSYNATIAYKLGGGVMTYAKIGSSYRAGGFNTNLGDPRQPVVIPAAYGNENSTTYEAGVRGSPTQGFYFAVAGYFTDLKNLIAQRDNGCAATNPACPVLAVTFLTNGGDARSYGGEAEATLIQPVAGGQFRATLTGSYQHGEVKNGQFANLRLPQVPDFLGSVNLNFRHGFIGGTTIVANMLYSMQFGGVQELRTTTPELDDFDLMNLRLSLEVGRTTFGVFANNVFDQIYRVARDTTVNRYNTPRVIGVEARYRF